jgi:energy-coupling factor transport system permease protein
MENFVLKKFNPSVKLIINLSFLVAALFSSSIYTSLSLLAFLVFIGISFREFKLRHFKVLAPFFLFAFSLVWMNGLWGAGFRNDEAVTILGIEFSTAGLEIGVLLALRVIIIIIAGLLFTMSSPPQDLILSLMQQLHFPPGFAYAILASLNLISDIKRDRRCLNASYKMRGAKGRHFSGLIIPILAINIRRCESISLAMEARGFCMNGNRSFFTRILWKKRDSILLLCCLVMILLIFLFSVLKGLPIEYAGWNGYE